MKRIFFLCIFCVVAVQLSSASPIKQPQQDSAPTLVPPTPVPVQDSGLGDALPSESAVARIQRDSKVRVGTLYNAPPGKVGEVQELYQKLEALNQAIDTATERWLELAESES